MISKKFENISIKGRLSYGVCCLEHVLIHYNCSLTKWKWVLEKLWEYTSAEYLDDWYYEVAELLPDSLLEDSNYKPQEFEYLSEKDFYNLSELYVKESNQVIGQIFRLIFEIGTNDLYSSLEGVAQNSLNCLDKIYSIMIQEKIELPSITAFEKYRYSDNKGWGESFQGKENSIIL